MGSKSARLRKRQELRRREAARKRHEEQRISESARRAQLEKDYKTSKEVDDALVGSDGLREPEVKGVSSSADGSRKANRHRRNVELVHGMADSVRDLKKDGDDAAPDPVKSRSKSGVRPWVRMVAIVAAIGTVLTGGVVSLFSLL